MERAVIASVQRLALLSARKYSFHMLEASEIDKMSLPERLRAIEQLWEAVCRESGNIASPDWHREVLTDRKRRAERGEAKFLTLAELRERLRGSKA